MFEFVFVLCYNSVSPYEIKRVATEYHGGLPFVRHQYSTVFISDL